MGAPDAQERDEATLILWAPDYDGGNKAWVRFADGSDAIVGGSQVKRGGRWNRLSRVSPEDRNPELRRHSSPRRQR